MAGYLEMSDDDFAKQTPPEVVEKAAEPVVEETKTDPVEEPAQEVITEGEKPAGETDDGGKEATEPKTEEAEPTAKAVEEQEEKPPVVDDKGAPGKEKTPVVTDTKAKDDKTVPVVPGSKTAEQSNPPDYEALYKQFMAPLKANGKTIELKTPEEALQLMRMGANYTKKMQDLAPHRKILTMLENNGLMDEGQLSFLIDIQKKNPDAIKKFLKDANIDPLTIDTESESSYREGNHRVTDDEVAFRTTLDELGSSDAGKETLKEINTRWDQASKEALWSKPELMTLVDQQRSNGIYQRIVENIDREKTLGKIKANTPFLEAYKTVGDQIAANGGFDDLVAKPVAKTDNGKPAPIATRVSTPKPVVKNNEKVAAASASRSTPKNTGVFVNPLAMSDEDFLKQSNKR